MDLMAHLVEQIELHSVEGIRECFLKGIHPNDIYKGAPLVYELTSEYARTSRFKHCVQVFVDFGLEMEDSTLLAVLLDDHTKLDAALQAEPSLVDKKVNLRCAYTPLKDASLLHVCAEFNHLACAKVLVRHGADINAKAGIDDHGFGGQTAIFHTVNQNSNHSIEMMEYLLIEEADLQLTVPGIIWGKGYEWETLIPAVNPMSYAMMGLLPQMHRNEMVISEVVSRLLNKAYGINYNADNVPCAYLRK